MIRGTRQQARKQLAALRAVESLGETVARAYVVDFQRRALAAMRRGGTVKMSAADEQRIIDELADLMTLAYVRRYRQQKNALGIELNLSFSRDVRKLAGGLDLNINGIRKSFQKAARKRTTDSVRTIEDRINNALRTISKRQQPTPIAMRSLRRRLDEMGVSLKRPSMVETLVRTHAQIAFGAAQYDLDKDDPDDIIWGYTYSTVGDDRVRPEHAVLDGLTRPKDDPIWETLWPPNGWNCRCQLIPLTSPAEITRIPRGATPDPGFDFNPGRLLAA